VNESMTQVMSPQTQTIWDISSRAFNDRGDGLVAEKISPADWIRLAKAGRKLRDRARLLAKAPHITVAAPGEIIMGEGASHEGDKRTWDAASAKQVQALIDAHPALFIQHLNTLADAGDAILQAAHRKDIKTVYEVSSQFDETCDGCHQPFWGTDEPPPYPKDLAAAYGASALEPVGQSRGP
ncbi:MAG TPA: hypothetical protein VIJ94_14590, partial [Caulobacteraceae bacterium]